MGRTTNFGQVYGRPRIKIGYGQSVSKVRRNIRQKTRKGGLALKGSKQFGFGGK